MSGLYVGYTDEDADEQIIDELTDWLFRRMPESFAMFSQRLENEPDFRASMIALMRGKAGAIGKKGDPDSISYHIRRSRTK